MNKTINQNYNEFVNEFNGVESIITPEQLKNIFSYVKNMEDNMTKLNKELEALKVKLDSKEETLQKAENGKAFKNKKDVQDYLKFDFVEKKQQLIDEMQEMVFDFKNSILEKAEDIRSCVHEKNLEGLNSIINKLHIREFCEKMGGLIDDAIYKVTHFKERVDYVEKELGQSIGHLKNIKDSSMPTNITAANIDFKTIKNCAKAQNNFLANMKNKNDTFTNKLGELEKKVEVNQMQRQEKKKEDISKILRLKDRLNTPLGLERC